MFLLTKPKPVIESWPVAPELTGWMKRIQEAEERGKFTDSDVSMVYAWQSCAVGECFGPDYWYDHSYDYSIKKEGAHFTMAVTNNNVPLARELFLQIKALADAR